MPAGAVVAAAAGGGVGIVELAEEELHAAGGGGLGGQHGLLVGFAGGGDAVVALGVVREVGAGGEPAAFDPPHGSVDVENFEHHLEAAAGELDRGLEGGE